MKKNKTVIINMTPHDVTIVDANGARVRVFPRSGLTIRCQSKTEVIGDLDGIPMTRTAYGTLTVVNAADGLELEMPEREEGIFYIVSSLAAQAARRDDFLVPSESVRDGAGRIVGCKSLGLI